MKEEKITLANRFKRAYTGNEHIWRLLITIILWFIFMALTRFSSFYNIATFQTVFAQFPEFGLMALGVMVCMITGGIDLSTVGIANLTGILMAMFMRTIAGAESISYMWLVVVFVLAIGIGAIAGLLNGFLISKIGVPPILATLGTGVLFTGISIVITDGQAVIGFPDTLALTVNNTFFGIPVQFIIFAVIATGLWFLMTHTAYGKKITMLGTSQNAAKFSGLKVDQIIIKTYMISSVCSALGGMIMLANYNTARAGFGENYLLMCILIVVLGGVLPTGGKGKIGGVLLAIFLVRVLETGLNRFPNISGFYISLIWGAVLLLVMTINFLEEHGTGLLKKKKEQKKSLSN